LIIFRGNNVPVSELTLVNAHSFALSAVKHSHGNTTKRDTNAYNLQGRLSFAELNLVQEALGGCGRRFAYADALGGSF
jgi:hypothetical protein